MSILMGASASAGPWGQADGKAFVRAAVSSEQIDGARAWRGDVYAEYGLSEKWTLISKAEAVQFPEARDFDAQEVRVLLQRRLISRPRFVMSVGGGVVNGAAIGGISDCKSEGAEARASVGTSGQFAKRAWYASIDASARRHSDGCERRKLDFVFGIERNERSTISPQIFIEESNRGAASKAVQLEWIEHYRLFDFTIAYKFESGDLFDQHATIFALSRQF